MSNREQTLLDKQTKIDGLSDQLNQSDAIFFTEYRGLNVGQIETLRSDLRELNASYFVMKNSLVKRTFSELKISCPDDVLTGPTGLVVSTQDCPAVASKISPSMHTKSTGTIWFTSIERSFLYFS